MLSDEFAGSPMIFRRASSGVVIAFLTLGASILGLTKACSMSCCNCFLMDKKIETNGSEFNYLRNETVRFRSSYSGLINY